MGQIKLKQLIFKLLKADDRVWNEDKTELNQTLLLDLVENIDEKIIDLLLQEKESREKFFVKIKDAYVFKTNDFRFFMEENKVDNSYTAYKNRIGLTDGKNFLKDTNDVVLNWPYRDCVLEGGQSSEEGKDIYFEYDETATKAQEKQGLQAGSYNQKTAKRKEIFFNSILAHDEIDRLFDAKALTNWTRFTKDGEQEVQEIKRDDDGTIKENLIIKGNNLLALHSLKKQFAGKVKLIYIDPPYNTGNDGFKYNDNFNHSTWLTFMKNRLEVARELLRDDGVIFVSLDDKESHYCKILMDNIFGRENFIADICHKSRGSISNDKIISPNHNHLILFAKNERIVFANKGNFGIEKKLEGFNLTDERGSYKLVPVDGPGGASKGNPFYDFLGIKKYWRFSKERMQQMYDDELIVRTENSLLQKYYKKKASKTKQTITTWWDDGFYTSSGTIELKAIMGETIFKNPKPEKLLQRIIEITTQENDIVLDFFGGSGTTGAVAHKMNRQYILIEQMDYIHDLPEARLIKVIDGEQGGISKSVNWQGGGDFIYFELAKWNETAKEKILACKSLDELIKFFDEMYEKYFLNYNLKIKEFREKVIKEKEFKNLSLDEQKKFFIAMLDNNQMYINKTEMADTKYAISEKNQELTLQFYSNEQ